MKAWGVEIVRIPTGYWNWRPMEDGVTPNAPEDVAKRYGNLQAVTPDQYAPYIDKIVSYCEKYGLKFFFELHGAPGS
jgi:aryl-phospho-beta-D-glucosidase BglC (GH1 family)